jgi:putative transposase
LFINLLIIIITRLRQKATGTKFLDISKMGYTKEFKLRCIKHAKMEIHSVEIAAELKKVSFKSLYNWIYLYDNFGESVLENKKPGINSVKINSNFEELVLQNWECNKVGSHKKWINLKRKGYQVSERQIQKVYNKNQKMMNKRRRPEQIKFVKYERSRANELWHTDWTVCPFTGLYLIAFIDDYLRFVVHAEYFSNASTENTLLAFRAAIKRFGKPENILTDNGVQFHVHGDFEEFCKSQNIKHILGRVHHPQTNGKIERWFGTYKQEFNPERNTLISFVDYYNKERPHQGINYLVPLDKYKIVINAV